VVGRDRWLECLEPAMPDSVDSLVPRGYFRSVPKGWVVVRKAAVRKVVGVADRTAVVQGVVVQRAVVQEVVVQEVVVRTVVVPRGWVVVRRAVVQTAAVLVVRRVVGQKAVALVQRNCHFGLVRTGGDADDVHRKVVVLVQKVVVLVQRVAVRTGWRHHSDSARMVADPTESFRSRADRFAELHWAQFVAAADQIQS